MKREYLFLVILVLIIVGVVAFNYQDVLLAPQNLRSSLRGGTNAPLCVDGYVGAERCAVDGFIEQEYQFLNCPSLGGNCDCRREWRKKLFEVSDGDVFNLASNECSEVDEEFLQTLSNLIESYPTFSVYLSTTDEYTSEQVEFNGETYTIELVSASGTDATIQVTDSSGNSDEEGINESQMKIINGLQVHLIMFILMKTRKFLLG